jgi:Baseplate J-like protein
MSTNVPQPIFGPTGFIAPTQSEILAGVEADFQAAFGGDLNFTTTTDSSVNATPQAQLCSSLAAIVGNTDDLFLFQSTQTDPAYAEGRWQDAIGRIYFLERIPAQPTALLLQLTGLTGTIIPINASVVDTDGNLYTNLNGTALIGVGGTVSAIFYANVPGPIIVPESVSIYQAVPGWDFATVISGVEGQNVETRSAFEIRRQNTVAQNSIGSLPSELGAVQNVPGVQGVYVTENTGSGPATVNGTILVPHSLYVCVQGGNGTAVAQAIWSRKNPGCAYNGTTTYVVYDTSIGYSPPYPSYNVTFQTPFPLSIYVNVNMANSTNVPSNALTLVQDAVISASLGDDGGPPLTIGSNLYATRFVSSIDALGAWANGQIIEIQLGCQNDSDAFAITGSIGGTNLVVTAVHGTIISGLYLSDASGIILPGTQISAQVSGSLGGTGAYTVNMAQIVASELIYLSSPDQSIVSVQVNQFPIIYAPNVSLTLT